MLGGRRLTLAKQSVAVMLCLGVWCGSARAEYNVSYSGESYVEVGQTIMLTFSMFDTVTQSTVSEANFSYTVSDANIAVNANEGVINVSPNIILRGVSPGYVSVTATEVALGTGQTCTATIQVIAAQTDTSVATYSLSHLQDNAFRNLDCMALSPDGTRLALVSSVTTAGMIAAGTVEIFNTSTGQFVGCAFIQYDKQGSDAVFSPDGGSLYVACRGSQYLHRIKNVHLAPTVNLTENPQNHPTGTMGYETDTFELGAPSGTDPRLLRISPDGSRLYVVVGASAYDTTSSDMHIYEVTTASLSVAGNIAPNHLIQGLAINPAGDKLYAGLEDRSVTPYQSKLAEYSASDRSLIRFVTLSSVGSVTPVVDSAGTTIYGSGWKVDASTLTQSSSTSAGNLTADHNGRLYGQMGNSYAVPAVVTVIDLESSETGATMPFNNTYYYPNFAVTPDRDSIYALYTSSGYVKVYQTDFSDSSIAKLRTFVRRFYVYCLMRDADSAGLSTWANNLKTGASTGGDVGSGFVLSNEFKARNLADGDFLDVLYRAFFDREADASGKEGWLTQLAAGTSRETVLDGFVHGQEFVNLCDQYGITPYAGYDPVAEFVKRFYRQCLLREADEAGLSGWTANLKSGAAKGADVASGFVFSSEFKARNLADGDFLDVQYAAFFNRSADTAGKAGWLEQMSAGTSRESVVYGFTHAAEFANLCTRYKISPY